MKEMNYKQVRLVLWLVLLANVAVSLLKLIFGLAIGSASLQADGFHSLSDGASNVVGLVGIFLASRPVDADHPYGHSKFETLAGLAIAAMLAVLGVEIVVGAVGRFAAPVVPQVSVASLAALLGTLAVNIAVTVVEGRQGRKLGSQILISDAAHTRSDIFVSLGVLATLVGVRLGLPSIIDPIASLVVAGFIFFAAWEIFRSTSGVLLDRAAVDSDTVLDAVRAFPQVRGVHRLRSRAAGADLFMDMHVLLDPDMSLEESHHLVDTIEEAIAVRLGRPAQITIHSEPYYEPGDPRRQADD